jgi:hypothetical protein
MKNELNINLNINRIMMRIFTFLLLFTFAVAVVPVQAKDDIGNEYRFTLFPSYKVTDKLTGFAYLGYVSNPEKDYRTYYLGWPAGAYSVNQWLQIWGGLVGLFTENENSADMLEMRPFTGIKVFLPNNSKWNIYNFTRYEYRDIQNRDTRDWSDKSRLRSRFGIEFPISSKERAWQTKTYYGLADVEPYYRFDNGKVDPFRLRAGVGYILNDRIRLELIYHTQFTHPNGSDDLEYTDNIYRLNVKIGMKKGIIGLLHNPDLDE